MTYICFYFQSRFRRLQLSSLSPFHTVSDTGILRGDCKSPLEASAVGKVKLITVILSCQWLCIYSLSSLHGKPNLGRLKRGP